MAENSQNKRRDWRLKALVEPHSFPRFMAERALEDEVPRVAASLSFTTTLAAVPALALVFAMMTAFPAFEDLRSSMQSLIFDNFLPSTSVKMSEQMGSFVSAAGKVTAFGVVGLAFTSILMLLTIESAFNRIFRVRRRRPLYMRLLVLWAVITVGPFLFAVSFAVFGAFGSSLEFTDEALVTLRNVFLGQVMPLALTWVALAFIYTIVPNRRIRIIDAVWGALFAAVMFAVLRFTFAAYVGYMTSYEAIYGAVAALPVFLIWVYLGWIMVLAGAVITATLPEWRYKRAEGELSPVGKLEAALDVIARLAAAQNHGGGLGMGRLGRSLTLPDLVLGEILDSLKAGRFVAATDDGQWILSRDLDRTPLADLLQHFGMGLSDAGGESDNEIGKRLGHYLRKAVESEQTILSVSLSKLIAKPEGGEA